MPTICPCPEPDQRCPCRPSHFLKIHLNITLQSTAGPSLWCPYQNPSYTCPLPNTRYMPRPSHSSRFDHPNYIWWGVQIIKLLIVYFSTLPCNIIPLRTKYPPLYPILKYPQATFLTQISHPYKTTGKIIVLCIFIFLGSKLEDKRFCTEW